MATGSDVPSAASEAPPQPSSLVLPAVGVLPLAAAPAYAAAALSGLLYWLAFPGVDAWPLTFVAWVPLLVAMHRQTARRAALLGAVAGLVMNVCGFFWLQEMLQTFSGFPAPICFLFVLIVCAYQAGRIAVLGWIYGRATSRGWPAYPVFAAAFAASELVYPVLFPWYYSATVHRVPVLMQVGDLGGPILVGLSLVAVNFAFCEFVIAWAEKRKIDFRPIAFGSAALALTCAYGAMRVRQVDAAARAAPAAVVGVVQANMGLMEKRTDWSEGVRRHLRMSEELRKEGADFVVWSETSAMHAVRDDTYRTELHGLASRIGVPAIFGAVVVKPVSDEREYVLYNSAVSSDERGAITGRYDKEYLLTFG